MPVTWTLRGSDGTFEYFEADDGHRSDIYRRKISAWNVSGPNGEPQGARWECSLGHFNQYPPPNYVGAPV